MYKLIQGNSIEYFKTNDTEEVSLVLTSPSYFTEEPKRNTLQNEIGIGESKEDYVNLIAGVIKTSAKNLKENGKVILVLGRYNDLPIESIIYMLEYKLNDSGLKLLSFTLHGKGNHESVVVFGNSKEEIKIPQFYKLQIYDKVGFFGRINSDILDWAITTFTKEGELVIDPFAGAGSTVKRADQLGRNGLGIELNPKFINTN